MKKMLFGLLLLGIACLIFHPACADPLPPDPFITLNSDLTGCIQPGDTIVYSVHFEGNSHEKNWDPVEFAWDPQYMDFAGYITDGYPYDCEERIQKDSEGIFQCRRAGLFGYHQLSMKVKDKTPDNTHLKMQLFAKYGYPAVDEVAFSLEKTVIVRTSCNNIPEFPAAPGFPTSFIIMGLLGVLFAIVMIAKSRRS
jgi:hypothetical protein